jgi:hypothetical protein
VIEAGESAGLGEEQFGVLGGGDAMPVRHLDGDLAAQILVVALVDDAEAAPAEPAGDAVAAEALGCRFGAVGGVGVVYNGPPRRRRAPRRPSGSSRWKSARAWLTRRRWRGARRVRPKERRFRVKSLIVPCGRAAATTFQTPYLLARRRGNPYDRKCPRGRVVEVFGHERGFMAARPAL